MDSYIDESLGKDECVVFRTKVHWSVLMAPLLLTVLFIFSSRLDSIGSLVDMGRFDLYGI